MSVRVRIPAPLRAVTAGEAEVTVGGTSVAAALGELEGRFPEIRNRLRDPNALGGKKINARGPCWE